MLTPHLKLNIATGPGRVGAHDEHPMNVEDFNKSDEYNSRHSGPSETEPPKQQPLSGQCFG